MKRCAVIGAGIAGLSCALELKRAGLEVDVYERESTVGGRMSTRVREGMAFDLGANFLVFAYSSLLELAGELGVELRTISPVRHVVYRGGSWFRLNLSSVRDVFRLGGLRLWSRLELLAFALRTRKKYPALDFFDLSSTPPELNGEDAYSYCCREITPEFADYVLDPFHSCMMFSRSSLASAAAFVALFGMLTDPRKSFGILHTVGDMQAIPDAIAGQVPVRTGCAVTRLEPVAEGWRVSTATSSQVYARVALATTAGAARELLKEAPSSHRELASRTGYASTINLSYRVPAGLWERTHCFYVPFLENPVVSEFTNEALKGEDTTRDGWSLINVGLHESAAQELEQASDGQVFERVRAELGKLVPELEAARPHDLQRWAEAIPRYDCAQVEQVRAFQRWGQGEQGLYLCGDYLNAPWLEGACRSGRAVARSILAGAALAPQPSP